MSRTMSAIDIKLAVKNALGDIAGSREDQITINPHVIFFNLSCPGGMRLEDQKSGYTTLTPDSPYPDAPDGAVVVHIDGQTYTDIFKDLEQEQDFDTEAEKRAKTLITEHCLTYCDTGNACKMRRKES
jgi:hypothetical protein